MPLPSFASRWLTPRIDRFIAETPGVEINLLSTPIQLDFTREGVDVGIRFGLGDYVDLDAEALMPDEMLAVASPDYVARMEIQAPVDLARCTLLRSDEESWALWFAHAGLDWPEPNLGLFFEEFALALSWAENGHGVALTRRSLADDALRTGRLVHILGLTLPEERRYWLVTPRGISPPPLLARSRDWILREARSMRFSTWPQGA